MISRNCRCVLCSYRCFNLIESRDQNSIILKFDHCGNTHGTLVEHSQVLLKCPFFEVKISGLSNEQWEAGPLRDEQMVVTWSLMSCSVTQDSAKSSHHLGHREIIPKPPPYSHSQELPTLMTYCKCRYFRAVHIFTLFTFLKCP